MALHLKFADMEREIEAIKSIASPFLATQTVERLIPAWRGALIQIKQARRQEQAVWEIPLKEPLRTAVSKGQYQPNAKGQHSILATINSIWEITPCVQGNQASHFEVTGKASTLVKIFLADQEISTPPIAEWRFDIASIDSPGVFFHNQIAWQHEDAANFDIPRLPTVLVTPMDVIEFVIGELFQEDWLGHVTAESTKSQMWRSIQKKRLKQLLAWKSKTIEQSSRITPWLELKGKQPPDDLFLGR